jgi:RNA polymerase sigma-70 factor, ECF subfamily
LFFSGTHPSPAPHNSIPDEPAVVALVDRAVASRDQAAFGEIYDLYLDKVYRYLYYRTGNHADAEDLAEQTFLKAWQAINRFRWQGKPFLAWLYRLAHNVLVDHQRVRRPTVSLQDEDHPRDVASEAAVRELAQRLDAEVLANAVRQLTAEQQQVIILKFIDGLENADIAQVMDKREGAIRALQLRALLTLRRVLEAQGEQA